LPGTTFLHANQLSSNRHNPRNSLAGHDVVLLREVSLIRIFWRATCIVNVRVQKTMIAIAPKLAAGVTTAGLPSSKGSVSGKEATTPFSSVLENAKGLALDSIGTKATRGDALAEGKQFSVSGTTKHEGKTSESKTGKLKGQVDPTSQSPVSSSDGSNQHSLPVVVAAIPVPIVPWNPGLIDVVPQATTTAVTAAPDQANAATSVVELANSPDAGVSGSMMHPVIAKDAFPAKLTETLQSSKAAPAPKFASELTETHAGVVKDPSAVPVATVKPQAPSPQSPFVGQQAEPIASVVKDSSGVPVTSAKAKASNTLSPVVEAPRGKAESTPTLGAIHSAPQPTPDQPAAAPTIADPVLTSSSQLPVLETVPAPATSDAGAPVGLTGKPSSDRAKAGVTSEIKGTARKNVDTLGNTKAPVGKSDTAPSATLQPADHSTSSTAAKVVASSEVPLVGASVAGPANPSAMASVTGAGTPQQSAQSGHEAPVLHGQPQPESTGTYPASVVHSGKLLQRIGETELRLGLHTGEFGSVDIRTSMIRNQFTAEISAERGDLGRMLAAELPSLHTRLAEQHVPVANITVQTQTGGQSAPSEQHRPQGGQPAYANNSVNKQDEDPIQPVMAWEGTRSVSRLDIHM
jgi:flagellar hook-length control protein FliK